MMDLAEKDILQSLDNCHDGYYCTFVPLGHVYSYLIDSRINVFRNGSGNWALAIERLGDNTRAGGITLDIYYFGNCLINLPVCNDRISNCVMVSPIATTGSESESRTLVMNNRKQFRASDEQLSRCLPSDLTKFLVIDEWFHKDFNLQITPTLPEAQLRATYEFNKKLTGLSDLTFEDFEKSFRHQMMMNDKFNQQQWENRPSTYETWQMIAKAIISGNPEDYKPILATNSHWSNWPESGSL